MSNPQKRTGAAKTQAELEREALLAKWTEENKGMLIKKARAEEQARSEESKRMLWVMFIMTLLYLGFVVYKKVYKDEGADGK